MKLAILVIDMINDFVTGKFENDRAKRIIPNIKTLVEAARSRGTPVIYVSDSHQENDHEFSIWGPHAIAGTSGAEIVPGLKPQEKDLVLEKTKYSAFFETGLENILEGLDVDGLVLAGLLTDICIQHTAADAFYRGYDVVVPRECVESVSKEKKDQSLQFMEGIYNVGVEDLDEFVKMLEE